MFDVVVPVGSDDLDLIDQQVEHVKANVEGCRNIYLISRLPLSVGGCTHVSESIFPFSLDDVAYFHGKNERNSWYLQQLFKLYAGSVIPRISEKYLVVDADTFFLRPTSFLKSGKMLFNFGLEYHAPYFDHMLKMHPTLRKVHPDISGICHHMIFDSKCLSGLFSLVEFYNKQDFWKTFLRHVSTEDVGFSGASEYEIYFNFMFLYYPDLVELRPLQWRNSHHLDDPICDYTALHHYLRKSAKVY